MTECQWATKGEKGTCGRRASVYLHPRRPCGHVEGLAPTCPGHAEALVGTTATRATPCRTCGEVNTPTSRPEDVQMVGAAAIAQRGDES